MTSLVFFSFWVFSCIDSALARNVHQRDDATSLRNGGNSFLESQKSDLRVTIAAVLGEGHDIHHGHLDEIRRRIESLWNSLATNEYGRIDKRSLRYAVHRYFMEYYSLSIVGLEPSHVSSQHDEVLLLSQVVPSYVRSELEGKAARKGFSLDDVIIMIATIERLVSDTSHDILEEAFEHHGKKFSDLLSPSKTQDILETYMIRWMLGDDPEGVADLASNRSLLLESIEGWPDIANFLAGQMKAFGYGRLSLKPNGPQHRFNELKQVYSISDLDSVVRSVTMSFGNFWTTECQRVKSLLIDMDNSDTGRVALSDFYGAAMNGEWRFSESKDYLRQLGALDESSMLSGPKIIITNYMQAASNCIVSSPHYRVCCANECESILSEVESVIGGPLGTPEAVLRVTSEQSTGENLVKLSSSLKKQLGDIARASPGGLVPLHGRLFAQWLHYAFPHECPFPHKSGETVALSPLEFGEEHLASETEMEKVAMEKVATSTPAPDTNDQVEEDGEWMSQWSHEEELLSESTHLHAPWESRISSKFLLLVMFAGGIFAVFKASMGMDNKVGVQKDLLPTSAWEKSHIC